MHHKSIEEISKRMAGIDIAILSTHTEGGQIANRPMSNNGDVEYDGTSYYFTFEQARTVADIQANPRVALGFTAKAGSFPMRSMWRSKATRSSSAIRRYSKRIGRAMSSPASPSEQRWNACSGA